jgi:nucleotide-binding universal stress UspA family protein
MSIKNILVHVDDSEQVDSRLDVAVKLVQTHDAHLAAIYAIAYPVISVYLGEGYVPADLIESQAERSRERASAARKRFEERMGRDGMEAEWREAEGYPADVISLNAKYADLTVVGQPHPDDPQNYPNPGLPAEVALSAGRLVLVVPYIGALQEPGRNVLVAWNGSREATRAVNDALPILERAEKVTVLAVNPRKSGSDHGDIPSADIALHLARHGVKAEASQTVSGDTDVGDIILSRISDLGADLVVMGAYGHSRMRELVMGGVTRDLLRHMTVPVLMSH